MIKKPRGGGSGWYKYLIEISKWSEILPKNAKNCHIFVTSLIDALLGIIGRNQAVTVTGRLICNGQPASGVLVKMYEDGTFYDSKMDSVKTSTDGTFRVSGSQTKIRNIDPKVNIYHKCNYNGLCSKKVSINIPKKAVGSSQNYDIGTINLANRFSGESTDCIH